MKHLLPLPLVLAVTGCGMTQTTSRPLPSPAATTQPPEAPVGHALRDAKLGSRRGTVHGSGARLTITQLKRGGSTTSLGLRLSTDGVIDVTVGEAFDDGVTQPIRNSDSTENRYSVDGVYLIDRSHGEKYLVARDPDGRCICDSGLAKTTFWDEAPLNLSATYGAPPPDVKTVDVVVPRFGAFANVPLG